MAVSVTPRSGVGPTLRKARVARGVSLAEAARETRIKPRFLEALERDAPPTAFRAAIYARAFLREYATYLGLDPEPLVADYRTAHGDPDSAPMRLPRPLERPGRLRLLQALLVLASIGVVATLAFVAARPNETEEPAPVVASPEPRAAAPAPAASPVPQEPVYEGIQVVMRIREEPAWVQVRRGAETILRRTVRPGFERTFRAQKRLEVVIGNAGAARLTLNGKRLRPPGELGDVYRASFVFKNGRARVIPRE